MCDSMQFVCAYVRQRCGAAFFGFAIVRSFAQNAGPLRQTHLLGALSGIVTFQFV